MLLAIDIGNTHVVFGLYEGRELRARFRLQTNRGCTTDEYAIQILSLLRSSRVGPESVSQIILCCVVPVLTRVFTKLAAKYFDCDALVVGPGIKTGIQVSVDDPRSVGADRIVNAVAAKARFGAPVIVLDFGTATTFDVIGKSGDYEGGIISPGLLISAEALFNQAAQLPSIELKSPETLIGKNTHDSMLSGIVHGYTCLVDGLIERVHREEYPGAPVVATGGLSQLVAEHSTVVSEVVPNLTLEGLSLVAELNREDTA